MADPPRKFRELLVVDLDEIDVHKGAVGTIVVVVAVAVVALFGLAGETAGLAVLFVLATDRPGPARARLTAVAVMTVSGAVIAFLAVLVGTDDAIAAALLAFAVTAIMTLASGRGTTAAGRALVLSIWTILALGFSGDSQTAFELALAFLLGGLIATGVLWFQSRGTSTESVDEGTDDARRTLRELIRSPFAPIALVRASAVAVGIALGVTWFPDHPVWAGLTVLLVMSSTPDEAIGSGLMRMFGTLLGVLAAEVIALVADGADLVLLAAFTLAAYGMFALKDVAYWVFVAFLTALLILVQALVGADTDAAAVDRLAATVLGAGIAFAAIGVGRAVVNSDDRR
jgi:uncharacterized membrane protein YccC